MLFQLKTAMRDHNLEIRTVGESVFVQPAPPTEPQVAVPGALGPGQAFFWDSGLAERGEVGGWGRCPAGNAASSHLEKRENMSWRSYVYLVRQPNMGH